MDQFAKTNFKGLIYKFWKMQKSNFKTQNIGTNIEFVKKN